MSPSSPDSSIRDALEALLSDNLPADAVQAIEAGGSWDGLWRAIEQSGFADALSGETSGGAGLSLSEVLPLWMLAGRFAMPVPLAETMVARSLLCASAEPVPDAPIALGWARVNEKGVVLCHAVVGAGLAANVLVDCEGTLRLLSVASARSVTSAFVLDRQLSWEKSVWQTAPALKHHADLRLAQALILSAQLAGALDAVFERTLSWANTRTQFGRPIGKFQAIQHQLALLAEESFASRIAAQIGCLTQRVSSLDEGSSQTLLPAVFAIDPVRVAVAKARTSEAALQGAQLAHAIHGAIGFTREFDLQLFTRRLHAWRQAAGSESYWHTVIGRALLGSNSLLSLDLLRAATDGTC